MLENFDLGHGVVNAGSVRPYRREPGDPLYRRFQIFSTDPAESVLDGSRTTVEIPYETLSQSGSGGHVIEIHGDDSSAEQTQVNFDDPKALAQHGLSPSATNKQFMMQMAYAVSMSTYESFRAALGRDLFWAFPEKLKIYPFRDEIPNAYYDRSKREVTFGWYRAVQGSKRNLPNSLVYTSLSHDIIVHEVSHALLDGMRPNFRIPYHSETLALHEAFADLVAVFKHFSHKELLFKAIKRCRGVIGQSALLTDIARQFGHTTAGKAIRTSIDQMDCDENGCSPKPPEVFDSAKEIHELGTVLVSAVFEAFTTIFQRKADRFVKLATGGTGVLPKEGEISDLLAEALAEQAFRLSRQFLSICIRAIDYCPPVAVEFGDYLRAMITADRALVPDDPLGYREALVDAFLKRKIPVSGVDTASEESLLWDEWKVETESEQSRQKRQRVIAMLERQAYSRRDMYMKRPYLRRAKIIGKHIAENNLFRQLGFLNYGTKNRDFLEVSKPTIESARVCRRVGPDGQQETDFVIEITQRVKKELRGSAFPITQGCTIIVDLSRLKIRHVIGHGADYIYKKATDCHNFRGLWKRSPRHGWKHAEDTFARLHMAASLSQTTRSPSC